MLNVMIKKSRDAVIFHCWGKLVAGEEAWTLYNTVISQQHKPVFELDLTGVDRVDARGLGVLVFLHQWASGFGIKLALIPSKPVLELLELTGLHLMFEIGCSQTAPASADWLSGADDRMSKGDQP
jgi:anti-anti-sigma factor